MTNLIVFDDENCDPKVQVLVSVLVLAT